MLFQTCATCLCKYLVLKDLAFPDLHYLFLQYLVERELCFTDLRYLEVRMPELPAVADAQDMYLCLRVPLPEPELTTYVVGFVPHSHKSNVHHITLLACSDDLNAGKIKLYYDYIIQNTFIYTI
jgi:hypothetical protein